MRLAFRIPQTFYTLVALMFFLGAISLSSLFHNEEKPLIRIAVQAVIFLIIMLIVFSAGPKSLRDTLWGLPVTALLSAITNSQYPLHLFLLTLVCLILIRRSERRDTDQWAYAAWVGAIIGLLINIALGDLGVAESKFYYVITSDTTKNSLGFYNPNIAAMLAASTVIFSSLAKRRLAWIFSVVIFAYVLSETYARTAAIILAIYYLNIIIVYRLSSGIKRAVAVFIPLLSLFVVAFIMFMELAPDLTQTEAFGLIDRTLSYRLSLAVPHLEDAALFFPGEAPRNMDFALANIIIVFGGVPLMVFLVLSTVVSMVMRKDHINFYLMCSMICFSSLFSENIAYIYMPVGLLFAAPFAYVIHHFSTAAAAVRARSPEPFRLPTGQARDAP
ncbi:hypothetical protein HU762_12020 [Pseudomonas sp. SWRI92]|uniref:hypothetical protein n=1 Tax=Pseudomonas sp. SWRI92 TaxID=2745499 RepID=UPI001644854F|nr:hypothetical protein [Pseudomonas sp. SWRI92]MBC3374667.1 hypothetical protein [Pseudomonas sp. SWRI92]